MSATITRQGGWVQLEKSDICLALSMAKLAQGGLSHAAIQKMQYLVQKPCTIV